MQTIEIQVVGMHCDGCERSIAGAIGRLEGITEVVADHSSGKVTVTAERDVPREQLATAVEDAGYELGS